MTKRQRQDLARAEADNNSLRDELALVAWERDGARKREVILAIRYQQLLNRADDLEQDIAGWGRRCDDVRAGWQFEKRRADTAELDAAKARAGEAAALLVAAEAQQDADTATELAQKSLANAASLAADVVELQQALEAAVGSGVEREFRP